MFKAKYPGVCGECEREVFVGQLVLYIEDVLIHKDCTEEPKQEICPDCFSEKSVSGACLCD